MLVSNIISLLGFHVATPASAIPVEKHDPQPDPRAEILNGTNNTSAPFYIPPRPDQTIGEYFDGLLSPNHTHAPLVGRHLERTKTLTEVIWTDGETNFNISMSRCLNLSSVAGIYSSKDGTQYNATIRDIINDLQVRGGSGGANKIEYASRVQENAQKAIDAANAYLSTAVADYNPTSSQTHEELRHLLAPTGQYVALIFQSSVWSEIMVALWTATNMTNGENSEIYNLGVAIVSSGFVFAQGCLNLSRREGFNFLSTVAMNIFLAWFRDAVLRLASEEISIAGLPENRTEDSLLYRVAFPFSTADPQKIMGTLRHASDPRLRVASQAQLEAGSSCAEP